MSLEQATWGPISDEKVEWYEENAIAAAAIMLPGTKGHMLANEAVPRLIREIEMLRNIVLIVCSHPKSLAGACVYCGAST